MKLIIKIFDFFSFIIKTFPFVVSIMKSCRTFFAEENEKKRGEREKEKKEKGGITEREISRDFHNKQKN